MEVQSAAVLRHFVNDCTFVFQEYYVPCTLSKKPLLILHFILRMKLSPILCFTNSRETAHRLETATLFYKHIFVHIQSFSVALLVSPPQTLSAGEALWWSSGCRVLLPTLSHWEKEDAEGVWTRKDPTVSLCYKNLLLLHTVNIYITSFLNTCFSTANFISHLISSALSPSIYCTYFRRITTNPRDQVIYFPQ